MPSFSGSFNPAVGPLSQVIILPFGASASGQIQNQHLHAFTALMDTGATSTCISQSVIDTCGLQPTGQAEMMGATGPRTVNQYTFEVGFMHGQVQKPDGSISGNMALIPTQGLQFHGGQSAFEVLLGRDVLCQGQFSMSFDGHWAFSF